MNVTRSLIVILTLLMGSLCPTADAQVSRTTAAAASPATADPTAIRASLDASRAELEQAQTAFERADLTSDALVDLRARIDPITERLRSQIAEIAPVLDDARKRLEQLGPKPKEGAPAEGADVAKDRSEREASVAEFDEIDRLARALLLQSEQLAGQISNRRRATFTNALFERGYSVASPALWLAAAQSFPRDLRALQLIAHDTFGRIEDRSSPAVLTLLGLAVGIGVALHIVRKQLAPRLVHRDPDAVGISRFRKLVAALGTLVVETLPAAAGSLLIYEAIVLLDVLPLRALPVAAAILGGLAFLAFFQGLADALFAPDRPAWRLVGVPDAAASSIGSFGVAFGSIVVVGKILDALNQAIAAGLPLSVAARAVAAVAASLTLAELLRRLAATQVPDEACLGPYIASEPPVAGPIRIVGWGLAALVLLAMLGGYVAFGSFLVDQIVWIASLAGLLYLAIAACDRFIGGTLKEDSRVSTALQANLGLRSSSLQQLGILASGAGRVILVIIAGMLALAPWGIESGDIASYGRAAFFGFKVGDVTISLSTTIMAILFFAAVVVTTRIVQRWLTATFLPATQLDSGLRNSITTAVGYLGFFVAAAAAFTYLGLSLEKMAIVAGALSVGIGFGLQSIVNNFVSGLILLWERPIRVGDLVVVGDGEGYVRRISVRATEIETFDRSTVIVPNSNLISGVVRNRVRNDKTGRVVLPVHVLRNQDPARAAEILMAQANAHPDVLEDPPPRVLFKKIGETWLEFDLVAYVDDVTRQIRVQSDLNFAVFKVLVGEGILPPLGPGAMNVGGLEPVQNALQQIAEAIAAGDARPGLPETETGVKPGPAAPEEPAPIRRRQGGSSRR